MAEVAWLVVGIASALALLGVIGSGISEWMNRVEDDAAMETAMRVAGHVPPETATEITAVIAPIRDVGSHATGYYSLLQRDDEAPEHSGGRHRPHAGCMSVSALLAREAVPA